MATASSQTFIDGSKNLVVKIHVSGGASQLDDELVIDPTDFDPTFTNCKIVCIKSSFSDGATGLLSWDMPGATDSVPIMTLSSGENVFDFASTGGLVQVEDATGGITLTTTGLSAGESGTVILSMVKRG